MLAPVMNFLVKDASLDHFFPAMPACVPGIVTGDATPA
jgi:hypothetical protein